MRDNNNLKESSKQPYTFIAIDYGYDMHEPVHINPDDPNFDEDDSTIYEIRKGFEEYSYIDQDDEYIDPITVVRQYNDYIQTHAQIRKEIIDKLYQQHLLKYNREDYYWQYFESSLPATDSFYTRIRDIFEKRSNMQGYALSQATIADMIGLTESALSRRIHEQYPFERDKYIKFCIALRLNAQELHDICEVYPYINITGAKGITETILRDMVNCGKFTDPQIPSQRRYNDDIESYKRCVVSATITYNAYIHNEYIDVWDPIYCEPMLKHDDIFIEDAFGPIDMTKLPLCTIEPHDPGRPINGLTFHFCDL